MKTPARQPQKKLDTTDSACPRLHSHTLIGHASASARYKDAIQYKQTRSAPYSAASRTANSLPTDTPRHLISRAAKCKSHSRHETASAEKSLPIPRSAGTESSVALAIRCCI